MKFGVKICCISSLDEAQIALDAGAAAIGLVGPMPSGPGVISNEQIVQIASQFNDRLDTFLLTSEISAAGIIAHARFTNTRTIQLVDHIEADVFPALRSALPGIRLVQVIHVTDESSLRAAHVASQLADALLLDSGQAGSAILGGTGKTHNWSISQQICRDSAVPVYLAGGLTPENVGTAVALVQPSGVDVCSRLRVNGKLDRTLATRFVAEAHAAANG